MLLCPRCQQPLPEPPARFCPHCGAEVPPATSGTPWERRDRIGFLAGLVETTQQVFSRPAEFFRGMPVTGGLGGPLLYGVAVGYVGLLASAVYNATFQALVGPELFGLSRRGELERLLPYLQGGLGLAMQLILGPLLIAIGLFIFAAIVHLLLMLLGGAPRGFEATFRVGCYAEAAALLRVIPFCGSLLSAACFLFFAIIGLSEAHGISKGRAAVAVLLPLLLACCCCAAAIALVVGGFASALGQLK